MKFGLPEDTIDSITSCLAKNQNIEKAIIYGSRAKGNYRKGSDIDLVLKGGNLNINDVLKLEDDLDELLLPYLFDISILHQIKNQDLLEHINRIGKVFYKSTIQTE
ncbi:MAG: nucleotidyltransferase domain-containing protein [Anditalea sp.]